MDLNEFIALYEQAKLRRPGEASAIPYRNPLLAHFTFFSVMEGLRTDWRELAINGDPGKHKPHRFWVRGLICGGGMIEACDRFWPREVVDDAGAAMAGIAVPGFIGTVPVPIGSLADAMLQECLHCSEPGPVIGTYMQTRNSIEFDEWELSLAVLCAPCACARVFRGQGECERFAHRIFPRI